MLKYCLVFFSWLFFFILFNKCFLFLDFERNIVKWIHCFVFECRFWVLDFLRVLNLLKRSLLRFYSIGSEGIYCVLPCDLVRLGKFFCFY